MLGRSCPQLLETFTLIATASCFCLSHSLTRAYIYYRYGTKIYEDWRFGLGHKRERGESGLLFALPALSPRVASTALPLGA